MPNFDFWLFYKGFVTEDLVKAKIGQILRNERGVGTELHLTIPIAPVTKKNSQQIIKVKGRYIPIPSKQYKKYEKECGAFIPQIPFSAFECGVNVECKYYMATKRRVDLVNLQEATLDVLVKYGVLADDNANIVVSMDGSKVFYDKENPRTEIEITVL